MDTTRIEEVIGDFVSLKKRGANHIGCCPFHNEKTPSFYVSPAKGIFKCFGCGKSGNAVGFLMDHEHYTYPEALRYLANKYNIEIAEERMTDEQRERQTERDALFHVSEFAQKYFADILYNNEMGKAVGLSYFHQRGLTDKVIKDFGLGYCIDEWSNFTDHARKNGYSDEVLEKTGLTIFRENGKSFDRFRGRVMFPIYSISGRVLGFSGRILSKEKEVAKYVNSPDSDIYNKSHTLYGLYQAKNAISRANKCYLVEGNVDVVSMHQSGVENTVASCGTSLTVEQIRLIKRYTQNVTVLYDGDAAGIKAALRAFNLLFGEGMHVRAILFPDNEDPDSYAQKYGSTQLQEFLRDNEKGFIEFKLYTNKMKEGGDTLDPIRKAELLKEIVDSIALVQDPLEQQEYIRQAANRMHAREETLAQTLANTIAANKQKAWKEQQRELAREQLANNPPAQVPPTATKDTPHTPTGEKGYDEPTETIVTQHTVAPEQWLPDLNPAEAQERQIAALLVKYGAKEINVTMVDEEDNMFVNRQRVADVVTGELSDNLGFDNAIYGEIFDLYAHAVADREPLPDANFFASHPNNQIRNTALELMMNTYSISPQWAEKKTILVPEPEDNIGTEVDESILSYKEKKLSQILKEKNYQLRQCTDEDEMIALIAECNELTKMKQQICDPLHRVVS